MARPSIPVDVIGNTAQLRKQIEELSKTPVVLNLQATQLGGKGGIAQQVNNIGDLNTGLAAGTAAASSFNRPLGKISGNLSEIDKSLGAANARVIAFGASAAAIFAVQNAVQQLFTSFVNTEKKLAEINTVLNLDQGGLKSFGKQVFKTAGQTGQSFDIASEAALEFSRQGLGVEETVDRTRQALILSRLSGLDAASSVNAITASLNSYRKESLTAGTVVNKLANVDAGFAVSSADLAEALSRVGSSASDAGVSFDELIALVTSAQQTTARGGAVIGNSLKTIFTRLNRGKTRELFGDLGISVVDEQGQEKNQIALLKDLATVYNTLGTEQKNYVAEQVGGVFQLNILKAALADLGRSYSVYDRALNTSLGTTNEAEKRNDQLNQTLSGLGTQTAANVQSAVSTIGEGLFAPAAKNVLNIADFLATSVNESESSSVGAQLGKGIVTGLGSFLSGPGLAIVGAVLAKLFADFAKYGATAAQSLLGLDRAGKNQAAIQQSVSAFLQKNAGLYSSIASGQMSATAAAKQYLAVINQQTSALQAQASIAKSVSAAVIANVGKTAVTTTATATKPFRAKAMGFIPNFSGAAVDAYMAKTDGGYEPGAPQQTRIGGKVLNWNGAESLVQYPGAKTEAIVPPENSKAGKAYREKFIKASGGMDPYGSEMAMGFIPNFAPVETETSVRNLQSIIANKSGRKSPTEVAAAQQRLNEINKKKGPTGEKGAIAVGGTGFGYLFAGVGDQGTEVGSAYLADNRKVDFSFTKAGLKKPLDFKDEVNTHLTPGFKSLAQAIYPKASLGGPETMMQYFDKSGTNQTLGRIFESAVLRAIRPQANVSGESGGRNFDIPSVNASDKAAFEEIFAGAPNYTSADFKFSRPRNTVADKNTKSFVSKLLSAGGYDIKKGDLYATPRDLTKKAAALGFIPNFANISEAEKRALQTEKSYGKGAELREYRGMAYAAQPSQPSNFKTMMRQDHPEGLKAAIQNSARSQGIASRGFIPNFAPEDDTSGQNAAIAASIQSLLFTLAFTLPNKDAISEGIKDIQKKEIGARQEALKKSKLLSKREEFEGQKRAIKAKIARQEELRSKGLMSQSSFETGRKKLDQQLISANNNLIKSTESINKNFERLGSRTSKLIDEGKIRSGFGQKLGGAGRAFGPGGMIGAAMAAPILADTIAGGFGTDTTAGKTISAGGQGLGYLAAGAAIGGVPGAIAGGLVGLATTYNAYSKASTSNMEKTGRDAEKASAEASRINDLIQTAMSQSADYFDNQAQGNLKQAEKAEESVMETIAKFGSKNAKRLTGAFYEGQDRFAEEMSAVSKETRTEEIQKNAINAFESVASELRFSQKDLVQRFKAGFGFGGATISKEQRETVTAAMQSLLFGDLRGKDLIKAVEGSGQLGNLVQPVSQATEKLFQQFKRDAFDKGVNQAYFDTEGDVGLAERFAENMGADIGGKELSDSAKKFVDSFNSDMEKFRAVISKLGQNLDEEQFKSITEIFKNFSLLDKVVTDGILKPVIEARETARNIEEGRRGVSYQEMAQRNFAPVMAQAANLDSPLQVLQDIWQKRLSEMQKRSAQAFEAENKRQEIIANMMKGLKSLDKFGLEMPRESLYGAVTEIYNAMIADLESQIVISQTGEKTNVLNIIKQSVPNYSEIIIAAILKDLGIVDTKVLQEKTEEINRKIQEFLKNIRVVGQVGDKSVVSLPDGRTVMLPGGPENFGATRKESTEERIRRMMGGGSDDTGNWEINQKDLERWIETGQTPQDFYNSIEEGLAETNRIIEEGGGGRKPILDDDFVGNAKPIGALKDGSFYNVRPSKIQNPPPFNLQESPNPKYPVSDPLPIITEDGYVVPGSAPQLMPSFLGPDRPEDDPTFTPPKFDLNPDYIVESWLADVPLFTGPRTSMSNQTDYFGNKLLMPDAGDIRQRSFMLQPDVEWFYPGSFPYREDDVPLSLNPSTYQPGQPMPSQPLLPAQPLEPAVAESKFDVGSVLRQALAYAVRDISMGPGLGLVNRPGIDWGNQVLREEESRGVRTPLNINTLNPTLQDNGNSVYTDPALQSFPQDHEAVLDRNLEKWENIFRNIDQPQNEPLAPVSDLSSSADVFNGLRLAIDRFVDYANKPVNTPTAMAQNPISPQTQQTTAQVDVQAPISASISISTDVAEDVVNEFNQVVLSQGNTLRTELQAGIAQLRREIPSIVRSLIS